MEKISDDKVQDELVDRTEVQDELAETSQEKVFTKVGWVGEPVVTLVTRTICPSCEAENSFDLKEILPVSPQKYRYVCSKCGAILETSQPFSSIVYVDRKSYEEQVKKSGTTTVRGVYE